MNHRVSRQIPPLIINFGEKKGGVSGGDHFFLRNLKENFFKFKKEGGVSGREGVSGVISGDIKKWEILRL